MGLRESLFSAYTRTERALVPGLEYSQTRYERVLAEEVEEGDRWLDLGCGHQLLPAWRSDDERRLIERASQFVGVDYDLPSLLAHPHLTLGARGDITNLPFPDEYFDIVTANMVVEHLSEPEPQFREIRRVLRPGGVFLFHTPNSAGYPTRIAQYVPETLKAGLAKLLDGRDEEDVFPTWYLANSVRQIEELAHHAGFEVVRMDLILSRAMTAMVLPLALIELMWIRRLMHESNSNSRPNLIVGLRRPQPDTETARTVT